MINKNIRPYYDAIRKYGNSSEMSTKQLGFLLGLIEQYRPNKIVEIGVAEGGTTVSVLQTLSMLDLRAEMYSIDLEIDLYRDKNQKTGHLIKEINLTELGKDQINHTLFVGKYAPECLENIGSDIDFLILDTVHRLPGEFLDFLACLPFLKKGCVVVLHDLTLNHYSINYFGYATSLLFNSVVGEKYIVDEEELYSGIGAIVVTDDTNKYIDNVFASLMITWSYIPEENELELYRSFYEEYYSENQLELFDKAVMLNKATVRNLRNDRREKFYKIYQFLENLRGRQIYIYGDGTIGRQLYRMLGECKIALKGRVISDGREKALNNLGWGESLSDNVFWLSEVEFDKENDLILIGVNHSLREEICGELQSRGIKEYIFPIDELYSLAQT